MVYIRKNQDRGNSQLDWLNSLHTFSFADYHDPAFMGFGHLRVINEDTVQPGFGFEKHPHKDMEIISYVIAGSLEHKDSMGNGSVIKPGEIQVMSAGTGIKHSEFNHSKTDLLHFLQIWIIPEKTELSPRYQQKTISKTKNEFILIGSKEIKETSVVINQDANLYVAYLTENNTIEYSLRSHRIAWLQLIKGNVILNGQTLFAGDGAALSEYKDEKIIIYCADAAELLFFDLAKN